jgi:hypothetical protein
MVISPFYFTPRCGDHLSVDEAYGNLVCRQKNRSNALFRSKYYAIIYIAALCYPQLWDRSVIVFQEVFTMASFQVTPVEKGIMRCQHTGPFTPEEVRALASFLHDYRGKLLIDLTGTTGEECSRHIKQFRPMMPTTAIFGAELDPAILEVPESYYTQEVGYFKTEGEALSWLRNQ